MRLIRGTPDRAANSVRIDTAAAAGTPSPRGGALVAVGANRLRAIHRNEPMPRIAKDPRRGVDAITVLVHATATAAEADAAREVWIGNEPAVADAGRCADVARRVRRARTATASTTCHDGGPTSTTPAGTSSTCHAAGRRLATDPRHAPSPTAASLTPGDAGRTGRASAHPAKRPTGPTRGGSGKRCRSARASASFVRTSVVAACVGALADT